MRKSNLILFSLLLFSVILCGLTGCSGGENAQDTTNLSENATKDSEEILTNENTVVLRVVTEKTGNFQMNDLVEDLIAAFQESHTDVIIDLEILPTDTEEREIRLEGLRAEILAGKGPDIYLMPTEPDGSVMDWKEELLFQDVKQSMHNELFADISSFYNADTDLADRKSVV